MLKSLKYLICALALAIGFSSCTKDEEFFSTDVQEWNNKAYVEERENTGDEKPNGISESVITGSTRSDGDTEEEDGDNGITDDEDDEDDDNGKSAKSSTK
jgi:hypothetical protein